MLLFCLEFSTNKAHKKNSLTQKRPHCYTTVSMYSTNYCTFWHKCPKKFKKCSNPLMTLLKYGDRVLSFWLILYLNVLPSCSPLMCAVRLRKALFCKLSSPSDDSQMSQQNKWVIFWFSSSCKLKIVDGSSTPLWNSLHLLFGGF